MSHGLFYRCTDGSGNISVALLSVHGQKALGFHHLICVTKMNEGFIGLGHKGH